MHPIMGTDTGDADLVWGHDVVSAAFMASLMVPT